MQNVDYRWNPVTEVNEANDVIKDDHIIAQEAENLLDNTPSIHHMLRRIQHVQSGNGPNRVCLELVLDDEFDCGETLRDQVKQTAAEELRQRNEKRYVEL